MYVIDVEDEDFDDEEKEENREKEATGPKLQSTNKPLITQSTSFETNSGTPKILFTESKPKASHAKDGYSSTFAEGRQTSAVTSDTSGSKEVSHNKSSLSFMHYYKTSSENESICNYVRETTEEQETLDIGENRVNSGKPVVSFQSTSDDYSVSKFSRGDLLIEADRNLSRHVKEKDAEDPVSPKTLPSRKSETADPHEESPPQHNEEARVDSTSRALRSSIRNPDRHSLAAITRSDQNSSTERRQQTQEPLSQPEMFPRADTTVRFEDWTDDVEQVEFSRTSRSLDGKEFIAVPSGGNLHSKRISNKTSGILRNSYLFDVAYREHFLLNDNLENPTALNCISKHHLDQRSSSRRKADHRSTARGKHRLDTKFGGSFNSPSTSSNICDCVEGHTEDRPSARDDFKVRQLVDRFRCKCQCGGSSDGLHLHAVDSEPHEKDYVDSSRQERCNCGCNSTAERNILLKAVSRRKRCEFECQKGNNYDVQGHLSEPCECPGILDSKTRSSVPLGNRHSYSLNRSCACHEKHLPCPCFVGSSHPQTFLDCPNTSRSTKREACKDLLLQMFKGSGVTGRQRGRQIKTSTCSQKKCPDFEALPETVDGSTIIQSLLIDENDHINLQVIGEIAGQLESRIIGYVFAGLDRKSSYGILVRNIPKVIETFCLDRETGRINVPLQFRLVKRFAYIKTSLMPFGYDFDFHPQFSVDMVNKYGRLLLPGVQSKFRLSPIDLDVRQDLAAFIKAACPPSEAEHVSVLLDCLLLLASDDGKSLFIWEQNI